MTYFKRHIFFCLNQRNKGEASCGDHHPEVAFDHCKKQVKSAGLAGPGGASGPAPGHRPAAEQPLGDPQPGPRTGVPRP